MNLNDGKQHADKVTYSGDDIPYKFDYMNNVLISKEVYESTRMEYKRTTLNGVDKVDGHNVFSVTYEIGSNGFVDGKPICRSEESISISNSLESKGSFFVCNDSKEWEYVEPKNSPDVVANTLTVYSPEGSNLNTEDFKDLVESVRAK